MNLWADFLKHDGRIIDKWKHYFPAYEAHFSRYVNRPLTFLEIGCGEGGSAQMWKRYFGPHARIVSIDINPRCAEFEEDQIAVRIGSQSDLGFLAKVIEEFGTPDVVLDDGSHIMSDVVTTFGFMFPRTAPDGVYMVEDLHTAYWDAYGGGVGRPGTFIELCKTLLDELNADHTGGVLPPTDFTRATLSMHFYDSVAVFERGRTTRKTGFRMGKARP
jgi:SAM-dependent methyltransferase